MHIANDSRPSTTTPAEIFHPPTPAPKVGSYVGKTGCVREMADALGQLTWEKPNRTVRSAVPLTDAERAQLAAAVALSPKIVRVGPFIGVERGQTERALEWRRDAFFSDQAASSQDAPNAILINLAAQSVVFEVQHEGADVDALTGHEIQPGEAVIFPINHVRYRLRGEGQFAIVRGFFAPHTSADRSV